MKIFYTENFKEDLGNETKSLYLGYYGLRHGKFGYDLKTENLSQIFHSSPINGYYIAQGVSYGETGVQLSLDVPSTDSSFYYTENAVKDPELNIYPSYYQVISFYYKDLTSEFSDDNIKVAFILFENFDEELKEFNKMNLVTLKNIITIPDLPNKKCNLEFTKDSLVEFLEGESLIVKTSSEGVLSSNPNDSKYCSREVIETRLDDEFRNYLTGYYRTSLINKYGLKLY